MKIAFLYPTFYPIDGGSSVHGYYLAKELTSLGHELHTFNKMDCGFTKNYSYNLYNILKSIWNTDIVYLRLSPLGKSRFIPYIASFLKKKIVIELNAPSDEYKVTRNFSDDEIIKVDNRLKKILNLSNATITVSDEINTYFKEYLNYHSGIVIENGGAIFPEAHSNSLNQEFVQKIEEFKNKYKQVIIWSGTDYPWQGLKKVKELISNSKNNIGYLIISNERVINENFTDIQNVLTFNSLPREKVQYLIQKSDIGLALYGDYSWTRFDSFYGSSLKFYEYLANQLKVIASPLGHMKRAEKTTNILLSENIVEMIDFIENNTPFDTKFKFRSWKDAAKETQQLLKQVVYEN